jgi:hypothetical protein
MVTWRGRMSAEEGMCFARRMMLGYRHMKHVVLRSGMGLLRMNCQSVFDGLAREDR